MGHRPERWSKGSRGVEEPDWTSCVSTSRTLRSLGEVGVYLPWEKTRTSDSAECHLTKCEFSKLVFQIFIFRGK